MNKMNITSAQYVDVRGEHASVDIIVDGQKLSVPLDPANRHYADIMRQVEAGELTIQEAEA